MGRSISQTFDQPSGSVLHEFSKTQFTISHNDGAMLQSVERDGFTAERKVDYVIGSGNAATGYLVKLGSHLFQSPLSFYTKRGVWDVAPGYEQNPHPEFERPVTAECLWCHSGRPLPVSSSVNEYREPVFELEAISCDRCHGPVEQHLQKPAAETILQPAKLAPRERDSVCEQCHLSGEARILNPGRTFGDFRPGMELEEVFSVFVDDRRSDEQGKFKVVSHAEQLAASVCAQQSGNALWCGTCHNPHETPADEVAYYRERCSSCHTPEALSAHPEPREDCVGCHMPSKQAYDSGHSAFTDHRIARRPEVVVEGDDPSHLKAWREPAGALALRNLGLAYFRVAEKKRSDFEADQAFRKLMEAMKHFEGDTALPNALGNLILLKDKAPLSQEFLQYVVSREPNNPVHYHALANAFEAQGARQKAIAALEKSIELDPYLESTYRILAKLYATSNETEKAIATWDRFLEQVPDSIFARQAKRELEQSRDASP